MLRGYHYVITAATTLSTCSHKKKKDLNLLRHSVHFEFHYFVQNNFFNFLLRSLRHGHVKKTKFHFSTTFTKLLYYMIVTLFYIQFHKKCNNCHYVNYAVIMTKKINNFISALLHSLHLDNGKKLPFPYY